MDQSLENNIALAQDQSPIASPRQSPKQASIHTDLLKKFQLPKSEALLEGLRKLKEI